jgi:hypothetical protein
MLDDADFERLAKIIYQHVVAIVDARMHSFEARFDKRMDSIEQRIARLDEQIKELRTFAIQMRDKQREIISFYE